MNLIKAFTNTHRWLKTGKSASKIITLPSLYSTGRRVLTMVTCISTVTTKPTSFTTLLQNKKWHIVQLGHVHLHRCFLIKILKM